MRGLNFVWLALASYSGVLQRACQVMDVSDEDDADAWKEGETKALGALRLADVSRSGCGSKTCTKLAPLANGAKD